METESNAYMKRLSGSLVHLRDSGTFCDTVIVTSDRQLLTHSIVLAAASPVFYAAFQSCTADSCMNYQLQLDGLDGQLMETILDCIYCGYTVPLDAFSSVLNTESVVQICEQLGVSWIISDKGTSCLQDQHLQSNSNERCQLVTGCRQQSEMERCISVRPAANNNVDIDGSFDGTAVVYDCQTADNVEMITVSSSLNSPGATSDMNSPVTEELRVYVCDVCSQRLFTAAALRRHRLRHKDCAMCNECGHSFNSSAVLRRHWLMQCPRKTVSSTGSTCRGTFDGWHSSSRHTAATQSAAFARSVCGRRAFPHVTQLVNHSRSVHATCVYQCRICHKSFSSRGLVKRHIGKHVTDSGKAVHTSVKCTKVVNSERCDSNNDFNLVNGGATALQCLLQGGSGGEIKADVSADASLSVSHLDNFVRDDHAGFQQKVVPRSACASESQMKDSDDYERSFAHSIPEPRSVTEILSSDRVSSASAAAFDGRVDGHCTLGLHDEPSVASPARRAAGQKRRTTSPPQRRLTCAECWRTFRRLPDLHAHMQRHTGEMRYTCHVCARPFRKTGTLARHMRVHTGERPYVCETCGKSFKLLFHLRLHAAGHTAELPFACELCDKAFRTASSLRRHRFTHTGLRPFACPVCSRPFSRANNMHAHVRAVHGDGAARPLPRAGAVTAHKLHDCILCRKKLSGVASLQLHLQTHAQQLELEPSSWNWMSVAQ